MNAIGYGADRNFLLGPSRKEWLKDMPAHLPVQLAHAVDLAAAPDGKTRHIEGFRSISRVLPSHREQILQRDGEFILRIMAEIFADEFGIEAVESGGNRGMRREDISRPRDIQGQDQTASYDLPCSSAPSRARQMPHGLH